MSLLGSMKMTLVAQPLLNSIAPTSHKIGIGLSIAGRGGFLAECLEDVEQPLQQPDDETLPHITPLV